MGEWARRVECTGEKIYFYSWEEDLCPFIQARYCPARGGGDTDEEGGGSKNMTEDVNDQFKIGRRNRQNVLEKKLQQI